MCLLQAIKYESNCCYFVWLSSWVLSASIPVLWTRYLARNSDLLVWIYYVFEMGSETSPHLPVTNTSYPFNNINYSLSGKYGNNREKVIK
jgi:hypothetical protein